MILNVENIKCGGCANGIRNKLIQIDGVEDIAVDVENGSVDVQSATETEELKLQVLSQLESMGYPEVGSVSGLSSVKAKATSYVSCAIGKVTDES